MEEITSPHFKIIKDDDAYKGRSGRFYGVLDMDDSAKDVNAQLAILREGGKIDLGKIVDPIWVVEIDEMFKTYRREELEEVEQEMPPYLPMIRPILQVYRMLGVLVPEEKHRAFDIDEVVKMIETRQFETSQLHQLIEQFCRMLSLADSDDNREITRAAFVSLERNL